MIRSVLALLAAIGLIAAAPAPRIDWTRHVTMTPEGSFVLGNPAAPTRLVEYVSYTCPHCAHFTKEASVPLRQNYVRTGKVAVEVRHAVRDGLDLTAAILTHCGAPASFFTRSEAVFAFQPKMFDNIDVWQKAHPAPADMDHAVISFAAGSGLSAMMAKRGIPVARQSQCLRDPKLRATLEAQTNEAFTTRGVRGTPTFLIDDDMFQGDWTTVDTHLRAKVK
jgi:protein-disulfide isomerase